MSSDAALPTSSIDATRKQKWLEVAAQFSSMPADDRNRIQQRMAEWVRMSPADRGRARMQYQEARRLSPGQLDERWQAYEALPTDQRQALAASAAQPSRKPATKPKTLAEITSVEEFRKELTAHRAW